MTWCLVVSRCGRILEMVSEFFQAALSEYHRLDGLYIKQKQKNPAPFSVLGLEVQDQGVADSVSGEDPLSSSQETSLLLCPQMAEGVREFSAVSFSRSLIPFGGWYTLIA